jgi:hypothetical protein
MEGADTGNWEVRALHPGKEKAVVVLPEEKEGKIILVVPVQRGCAMVSIDIK